MDRETTQTQIKAFSNQKPWVNREVCLLLKVRDAASSSGDQEMRWAYSSARANLRIGISQAQHLYKQRNEEQFLAVRSESVQGRQLDPLQTFSMCRVTEKTSNPVLCPHPSLLPTRMSSMTSILALTEQSNSHLDYPEHGQCTEGSWSRWTCRVLRVRSGQLARFFTECV